MFRITRKNKNYNYIAKSESSKNTLASLKKIIKTESSVFLNGEKGSGREFLAKKIHSESNRFFKNFKPLVDEDIMYYKISKTIQEDTQGNWKTKPKVGFSPKNHKTRTHQGIEDKKQIISFKPRFVILDVMIFM